MYEERLALLSKEEEVGIRHFIYTTLQEEMMKFICSNISRAPLTQTADSLKPKEYIFVRCDPWYW